MSKKYLKDASWILKNDDNEYSGTLDENGHTDLKNIKKGEYTFTLSKKGYVTKSVNVLIEDNPINIDIDLEKEAKKTAKKSTKSTKKTASEKAEEEGIKPKKSTKKSSTKKSDKKESNKKDEE